MCEIAVLDPAATSIEVAQQIAFHFNEEQGDGLGLVAVRDEGDKFTYDTYKSTEPHWQTVYGFLNRNFDQSWRIVIHARYATSGNVNRKAAHPIEVDCDMCEYDYVVHNGSVRNYKSKTGVLKQDGHDFNTGVDTEVIAHEVQETPESTDDLSYNSYNLRGNLNYLLFGEDSIFVRVQRKYDVTDDFRMTCRLDELESYGFDEGNNRWLIARPGGDIDTKESTYTSVKRRNVSSSSASGNSTSSTGAGHSSTRSANGTTIEQPTGVDFAVNNDGSVTETFDDHLPGYDHVIAIKVAPGVMRIIDTNNGKSEYVKRRDSPRTYYWYAPEPQPDAATIDELETLAENHTNPVKARLDGELADDQSTLDDLVNDAGSEAHETAKEEAARAAEAAVERTVGETADFGDGIEDLFDDNGDMVPAEQ